MFEFFMEKCALVVIFLLNLYALYDVLMSAKPFLKKTLWIAGVIALPVLVPIVYLLFDKENYFKQRYAS